MGGDSESKDFGGGRVPLNLFNIEDSSWFKLATSNILKSSRIKAMDTKNPFQPCSKSESLSTSLVNNSKFIFPFQEILGIGRE